MKVITSPSKLIRHLSTKTLLPSIHPSCSQSHSFSSLAQYSPILSDFSPAHHMIYNNHQPTVKFASNASADLYESPNVRFIKEYIRAMEKGGNMEQLRAFYSDDFVQIEFPNALNSTTHERTLQQFTLPNSKFLTQSYEIKNIAEVKNTNQIIVDLQWSGIVSKPIGNLLKGDEASGRMAIWCWLHNMKIKKQYNYECVNPCF